MTTASYVFKWNYLNKTPIMAHEHKQETFLLEKDQTIITREESTLYENIYSPLPPQTIVNFKTTKIQGCDNYLS